MQITQQLLARTGIALAAAALLGTVGLVGFDRSVDAFERAVDARARRLEQAGVLPEAPYAASPAARHVQAEFERLTVELEQAVGSYSGRDGQPTPSCTPYYWDLDRSDELERQIAAAEPVLAELDVLLASPEAREILETDAPVIWTAHRKFPVALGSLARVRHWANVLDSRAVVQARRGDHDAAAASLVSALELLELVDRGTMFQFFIASAMRQAVMRCAEHILALDAPSAAGALNAALEPLLEDMPTSARIERYFATDVACFKERSEAARDDACCVWPWNRLVYTRELDRGLRTLEHAGFDATDWNRIAPDRDTWSRGRDSLTQRLGDEQRHTTLARVTFALQALEQRTGAWPASLDELAPFLGGEVPHDPVTGTPLHYTVDANGVLLAFAHVLRDDYDGPDYYRDAFTWRRPVTQGG